MNFNELKELLLSDQPSSYLLANEDNLFSFIPELKVCKGFDQRNPWHIYDVYVHTLHVVDGVPCNLALRLAALFHDIGKPIAFNLDDEGIGHFHGHWEYSKDIFHTFALNNNLSKELTELVEKLIYYHDLNFGKLDEISLKKVLSEFNKEELELLYLLKRSDLLAHNEKMHYLLDDYNKQEKQYLKMI